MVCEVLGRSAFRGLRIAYSEVPHHTARYWELGVLLLLYWMLVMLDSLRMYEYAPQGEPADEAKKLIMPSRL